MTINHATGLHGPSPNTPTTTFANTCGHDGIWRSSSGTQIGDHGGANTGSGAGSGSTVDDGLTGGG